MFNKSPYIWLIYLLYLFVTLHALSNCMAMKVTKPRSAYDWSRIVAVLTVRRATLAKADVNNYCIQERLVAIVCEHEKQHTGQMMNQVMTAFSSNLGSPRLFNGECKRFSSERSTYTPNGDLCHCCRFHWTITAQTHIETISGNSEYRFRPSLATWRREWMWSQFGQFS